ncbi:MAG: PilC/PilY family type IV pilus protein, partial [Myxococcota bacterium]
ENDGSDNFTQLPDISFAEAGITFLLAADFDGDGDDDIVVGRDGWNCGGNGGDVYYFDNDGGANFARRTSPIVTGGADLDIGIAFDIDSDADATPDLIAADGNNSGTYNQILSSKSNIYNLSGRAVSLPIVLDAETEALTQVTINVNGVATGSPYTPPAGTSYEFYVSSNDGSDWELVPNSYLDGSQPFTFTNFGSKLRWRIDMSAEETALASDEALFAPASVNTPEITSVAIEYTFVDRRLYSRSGLALASGLDIGGDETDVLYGSAFFFPGNEGFLYAYDITGFEGTAGATGLTSVSDDASVNLLWEAGDVLSSRGASSRTIYTARDADSDGVIDDRFNFEVGNNAVLAPLMALSVSDTDTMIDYVRDGMDHSSTTVFGIDLSNWKLYDAGHSSPVFVGAPREDENAAPFVDNNYAAFKSAQETREPRLYIASNAGFIHSFDAKTGEEEWAFIPHNLLNRLPNQRGTDASGDVQYEHQFLVDGQLVVRDIFDSNLGQWRTILISGQAQGQGRSDYNYYFALDVTDPADPLPMWEFTDPWDNTVEECTGANPITVTSTTCSTVCTDSCTTTNHVFEETSPGNIFIEAEQFNSTATINGVHDLSVGPGCPNGDNGTGFSGDCLVALPEDTTNCDTVTGACGAQAIYEFVTLTAGTYRIFVRGLGPSNSSNSYRLSIDETAPARFNLSDDNEWEWVADSGSTTYDLAAGDHTLTVYMRESGSWADRFLITTATSAPSDSDYGDPSECIEQCENTCAVASTEVTLTDADEWPECGIGDNERCCTGEISVCHPVGDACLDVGTAMGETWSRPAVGRARVAGLPRYLTFFGSGYDNIPSAPDKVGRSVYAIDAVDGELVKRWTFDDVPEGSANPSTIDNTIPATVELVDYFDPADATAGPDGYLDRLYVGDLEGRVWKVELDQNGIFDGSQVSDTAWPACVLFDAGDPERDGVRTWAPVITKPAVAFPESGVDSPQVYFGTGGDDRVPDELSDGTEVQQRFYSIRDDQDCGTPYDT